uniref:Uncharacterized protein n=1 Tax=Rhizophora mucronata TaxID=61149 RepID=A0A2P2R4I4_RHIMU
MKIIEKNQPHSL